MIRDEDLLDAARDVFREEGHAATTAKIAKRAGVSEGILYYRYKSKETLLVAVIHRETEPPEALRDVVKAAGQRSVAENLVAIVEILVEAVSRAHPFLELALTSSSSGEIHKQLFAKARKPPPQRMIELIAEYLEAEIHLGRVRTIDTLAAARATFGGCIEHVRASGPAAGGDEARQAFVRGLADLLLHGTARTASSRRQR
jgi:AcrR family transcriptional regulator